MSFMDGLLLRDEILSSDDCPEIRRKIIRNVLCCVV